MSNKFNDMSKYINRHNNKIKATIEFQEGIGFYLYIYDENTGQITHDYLENTFFEAKQKAQEDFNINEHDWNEIT